MKKLFSEKQSQYPCQYCGECPVWLSYGEEGGPQTDAELELECQLKGCDLIGRTVFEEEMFGAIQCFMSEVVRYIETTPEMPPIPKDNFMKQMVDYVSKTLHPSKDK